MLRTASLIFPSIRENSVCAGSSSDHLKRKPRSFFVVVIAFCLLTALPSSLWSQPLPLPSENKRTVGILGTSFGYRPQRTGNRLYHEGFWSIHGAVAPIPAIRMGFRYMVIGAYTFPRRFGDYSMLGPYLQLAPLNTRVLRLHLEGGYYMGDFCFCSLDPPPPQFKGLRYWNAGVGMEIHVADAVSLTLSLKHFKTRPASIKDPGYSQVHLGLNYRFRIKKGLF